MDTLKKFTNIKIFESRTFFHKQSVVCFSQMADFCSIAKTLFVDISFVDSFDEIQWYKIFFRKIRIISIPPKSVCKTKSDKWKRRMLRWFGLNIHRKFHTYWIQQIILQDHGPKLLVTPSIHVKEIYNENLPHFKVALAPQDNYNISAKSILKQTNKLNTWKADTKTGVTVFANNTSEYLIRAYRKLHPNRIIILRYHDILGPDIGGPLRTKEHILSMLNKLKKTIS